MSKGKFAFSVATSVVNRGSKVSSFANPTLYTSPVKDKFVIDSKGKDLLKITEDNRILIIDMGSTENVIAAFDGVSLKNPSRYMLAAGYKVDEDILRGSKIGKNNVFNYTKVWGSMLNAQDNVREISMKELVAAGIITEGETPKGGRTYGAKYKLFFRIEPLMGKDDEGNEEQVSANVGDDVEQPLFSLIQFAKEEVKEGEDETGNVVEEEVTED